MLLAVQLFRSTSVGQLADWLTPLLLAVGLLVAGYLAYIEMTLAQATCGVLGDCNAVQQSPYARVLGIPVGVIGILGYLTLLVLWGGKRFKKQQWLDVALFVMALAGVGFSTYLTFLEPFVIGASCAWCLTSAVVMGILLWMTAPAGLDALYAMKHSDDRLKKSV
ncbi:MAG: vitamin K epoxide reductase family protein [Chloroflexi bacterium]|nr:vitamin K epoxide reductase family protein [Chloroflexota bacterium]